MSRRSRRRGVHLFVAAEGAEHAGEIGGGGDLRAEAAAERLAGRAPAKVVVTPRASRLGDERESPCLRLELQRRLAQLMEVELPAVGTLMEVSTPKSQRAREPELFKPVARELVELYLARGRPSPTALVFPDTAGGHLRRQNWRRRVWIPALERAGVGYFRSYDLRHTCATCSSTRAAP